MTAVGSQIAEPLAGGQEPSSRPARSSAITEPFLIRVVVIVIGLSFIGLFLVLPLIAVFAMALEKGLAPYFAAIADPDALAAVRLTLTVAAIAVPANLIFGLAAAWGVAKLEFDGTRLLGPLGALTFWVAL